MSPLGVDMNVVWAKERGLETPYPLLGHLLDTSAVMGELYHRWLRRRARGTRRQAFNARGGPA